MKEKKEFKYKIKTEFGYEWICPVCGETIPLYVYVPSEYAYKVYWHNKTVYFDSWSCMREFEKINRMGIRSGSKKKYYNSSKYN